MKNILLTITLVTLILTNASRFLHTADLWLIHKLNHSLVSVTCDSGYEPSIVEAATSDTVIVSCDKIDTTNAKE